MSKSDNENKEILGIVDDNKIAEEEHKDCTCGCNQNEDGDEDMGSFADFLKERIANGDISADNPFIQSILGQQKSNAERIDEKLGRLNKVKDKMNELAQVRNDHEIKIACELMQLASYMMTDVRDMADAIDKNNVRRANRTNKMSEIMQSYKDTASSLLFNIVNTLAHHSFDTVASNDEKIGNIIGEKIESIEKIAEVATTLIFAIVNNDETVIIDAIDVELNRIKEDTNESNNN